MTSTETATHRSGTIRRALNVLREATAVDARTQTRGVALALWNLRSCCSDDWLVSFWEAAGSDNDIGRCQGLHAAYNGIVREIRANGGIVK